jgi:hypothetical protein
MVLASRPDALRAPHADPLISHGATFPYPLMGHVVATVASPGYIIGACRRLCSPAVSVNKAIRSGTVGCQPSEQQQWGLGTDLRN